MGRNRKDNVVVGLDIGTTKICAVIGEIKPTGLNIIGMGTAVSKGLRKGVVINIDATVMAIEKAIKEAQLMAGCEIAEVYAGIAGSHIRGVNSHGIVAIKEGEVSAADVERVMDAAKAIAIPADREVIHVLPQEFIIDEQGGIKEPVGMSGVRLEAKVHIVTGAVASAQNIIKCAQKCSLKVNDIVLEQLASAHAVLGQDEKDLGVALIDIGGGTTDIAVFVKGAIQHTAVIAIGGQHLTNDIAIGLRTPQESAEQIKKEYGCANTQMIGQDEVIEVPSIGNREPRVLRRKIVGDILEPRVQELFELVAEELSRVRLQHVLASGVVLTGGTALLPGILETAEEIIGLPARLGVPTGVGGLSQVIQTPVYATGVGLAMYGAQFYEHEDMRNKDTNIYKKVRKRMSAWLQNMME